MSVQPNGGRYMPDPYAGIHYALITLMVLGTLLTVWYALSIAGLLPAPPLLFPPPASFPGAQRIMVYVLAMVSASEHVALPITLRYMQPQPGEGEARFALRRVVLRLGFTVAVWMYIAVLWAVVSQRQQQPY